jgi:glutamyl-tRNA reductase
MTVRRRSIVEFEKWVDGEIARVTEDLNKLDAEVEEARRRRALEEVRLATLGSVKKRLAVEADETPDIETPEAVGPAAEAHEPGLTFDEPEAVEAVS